MKNSIDSKNMEPHYSTKLWRAYWFYLSTFHNESIFDDACDELGVTREFLLTNDEWVSDEFTSKFIEIIKSKTSDDIAFRVGEFSIDPRSINDYEYFIFQLLPMPIMLALMPTQAKKLNRVNSFKVVYSSRNEFQMEVINIGNIEQCTDVIKNVAGLMNGIFKFYKLQDVNTSLIQLESKNGWIVKSTFKQNPIASAQRGMSSLIFVSFVALFNYVDLIGLIGHSGIVGKNVFYLALLFASFIVAKAMVLFRFNHVYLNENTRKQVELFKANKKLERKLTELELLRQLSDSLVGIQDQKTVIDDCLNNIGTKFGFKKAAVFLINKQREKLLLESHVGFDGLFNESTNIEFVYPNPDEKDGFFATIIDRGEARLITDIKGYKTSLKPENQRLLDGIGVGSMIVLPLKNSNAKFGAVVVVRGINEAPLTLEDKLLLESLSSQLSLYFESAGRFERESNLRSLFQRYVPSVVYNKITTDYISNDGSVVPEEMDVCSMFFDLRSFTNTTSKIGAEKAINLVNIYSDFVSEIVLKNGGTIDNLAGDGIATFFQTDGTSSYIDKCLAAIDEIKINYSTFENRLEKLGIPKMRIGVGIHSGSAMIGTVGGKNTLKYTAIGEAINIAARLEPLGKAYANDKVTVMVSKSTIESSSVQTHFEYKPIELRGISDEIFCSAILDGEFFLENRIVG
jgi:class 3 adenylate cyclase